MLLISQTVWAQTEPLDNHFFMNFSWYSILEKTPGRDFNEKGAAATIGYGRVLSDYVGVEASVSGYNEVKDKILGVERTIRGAAVAVHCVGYMPIYDRFRLLAKIGLAHWKFKYASDVQPTENRDDVSMVYGAGFAFDADHDSTLRLEYEGFSGDPGVKAITLGIQHNF